MRLVRNNPAVVGDLCWDAWNPASPILLAARDQFRDSSVEEVAILTDLFTILVHIGIDRPSGEYVVWDFASSSCYACEFLDAVGPILLSRLASVQLKFVISASELRLFRHSPAQNLTWAEVRQCLLDVSSLFDTTQPVFDYTLVSKRVCLRAAALISTKCPFFKENGVDIEERAAKNLMVSHRPGLTNPSPDELLPENEWLLRLQCATETACTHVGTDKENLQISYLDPYHCHECYMPLRCRPGETRGMLCLRYLRLMASTMCHEFVHVLQSLWGQKAQYWQIEHDATFIELGIFHMLAQDTHMQDLFYPGMFAMFMYDHSLRTQHFVRGFDQSHWSCVSSWVSSFGSAAPSVPEEYKKMFGAAGGSEDFGSTELDASNWTEEDWRYLRKWCNAHGYSIEGDTSGSTLGTSSSEPLARTGSVRVKIEQGKISFSTFPPSKFKTHVLYIMTPACSYQGLATPDKFELMLQLLFENRSGQIGPVSLPPSLNLPLDEMLKSARESRGQDWCLEISARLATTVASQENSTGKLETKKPKLRKPTFVKVRRIKPDTVGLNLYLKVLSTIALDSSRNGIVEAKCGDDTGAVTLSLRGDQICVCKVGASIIVRNAHVKMFKGFIRVVVDKWGKIEHASSAHPFSVKETPDISSTEYELMK